jgi:hypothetical protein
VRDLDVSTDPTDYLYGPTGNHLARTQGGTNRTCGVSVVEVNEDVQNTQTAEPPRQGESTPAPAPASNATGADSTQQQQQSTATGSR